MKLIFTILVFIICNNIVYTQGKVESCNFKTQFASKDFVYPKEFQKHKQTIDGLLKTTSEGIIVNSIIMSGNTSLGLSKKQVQKLSKEMIAVYQEISLDRELEKIKSSMPYCFSEGKTEGHYFVYTPEGTVKDNIIFLHGSGGNFLFYIYLLKKNFPDFRIIIPTYGMNWDKNGKLYLNDMLKDINAKYGEIKQPWLMSISGGGPLGFEFYNQNIEWLKGYICIASCPNKNQINSLNVNGNILMINGRRDKRFPIISVNNRVRQVQKRVKKFTYKQIDSDHFFLLSNRKETFDVILQFFRKQSL